MPRPVTKVIVDKEGQVRRAEIFVGEGSPIFELLKHNQWVTIYTQNREAITYAPR